MPPSLPAVSLAPAPPLSDAVFPLAIPVSLLQKFVNSGVNLPITLDDFTKEFSLTTDVATEFKDQITPVLTAYDHIRTHTRSFKADILPPIVGVASSIFAYAEPTYINLILTALTTISNASHQATPDATTIENNKQRIAAVIPGLQSDLTTAILNIGPIIVNLGKLKTTLQSDVLALETALTALQQAIDKNYSDTRNAIAAIQAQIDTFRAQIAAEEKAYEQNVGNLKSIPAWGWIPFVGWIAAATLGRQWAKNAVALSKQLLQDKKGMSDAEAKIASIKNLSVSSNTFKLDLTSLLAAFDPVTKALSGIQGAHGVNAASLSVIGPKLDNKVYDIKDILIDASTSDVLAAWSTLRTKADAYRQYAYVGSFDPLADAPSGTPAV